MSEKVYNLIFGITTGVVAIAEAVCAFCIADPFIKGAVLASIPIVGNGVIAICKNFVKPEAVEGK